MAANREHGRYAPRMLCTSTLVRRLSAFIEDNEDAVLELARVVLVGARP